MTAAVVRTSLSALLKDAAALEKALGGEEQALGTTLEEARRIMAAAAAAHRDPDETLDEDDDDLESLGDFAHLAGLDSPDASPVRVAGKTSSEAGAEAQNTASTGVVTGQGREDEPVAAVAVKSPGQQKSPSKPASFSTSTSTKPSSADPVVPSAAPSPKSKKSAASTSSKNVTKAPVFAKETAREMFDRYDVDGSGFLDFEEVSVALADMGALDGVLASAAAELFQEFDSDGDGTVDFEEFQQLSATVRDLKGSVGNKPIPEVPAGFMESASALPLRRSFEAFAAFGKGRIEGRLDQSSAEMLAGRGWNKLVKDCGLIGGAVTSAAADIIFALCAPKGKRVLRWDDGTFLLALAHVAAEHRVTFGQVAARVAQCAPQSNVEAGNEEGSRAAAEERAAAASARAAAESANGPSPSAARTSRASLLDIFETYVSVSDSGAGGAPGEAALAAVDVIHALADVGLLRGVALGDAQAAITTAIAETPHTAGGKITFEPFAAAADTLRAYRAAASYRPPDAVQLPLDQRRALQASFQAFGGGARGMDGAAWETTVRACGLIGAKVSEATAAIVFAKCKEGAGGGVMAPKVLNFQGFVQAAAHVAQEYSVKFEIVAQRVIKCTPAAPADGATAGEDAAAATASAGGPAATDAEAASSASTADSGGEASASAAAPALQLAKPVEIPDEYRSDAGLSAAFASFATHGDKLEAAGWGRVVRACGLVGGALTDAVAQDIFVQSGAPRSAGGGHMGWEEFLWACAVVGGTHGVMFKIVAARVVSVAQRQEAAKKAAAGEAGGGGGGGGGGPQSAQGSVSPSKSKPAPKTKKKSSMFSMFK